MGVSSIQNYGLNSYQMQQLLTQSSGNTGAAEQQNSSAYSATQTVSLVAELTRAVMEKMGVGKNDRVSFGQINSYRQQMEEEYAKKIAEDFENLGIDSKVSFQLKENTAGGLVVSTSHPDRDKIQKYFDDNPEMVEQYNEIQALANLDAARKSMDIQPAELKKRIQIENMSVWWESEGSSSIMNMSSSGINWFSGINSVV